MKKILLCSLLLLCGCALGFGQQTTSWDKFDWLIGKWVGEGGGNVGVGGGSFSFKYDLNKKVIVRKSHSEFKGTDKKPRLIHDDLMVIYLDTLGNASKAIYFDNENHVINYTITYSDKTIIFTSEKFPATLLLRLTYTFVDPKTVDTKFEMSQDGVKFITYIAGKSKKKK